MREAEQSAYGRGMAAAMSDGGIFVPALLLRTYRKLGLTDTEAMLLLQLAAFRQTEWNEFPTLEQLAERMGMTVHDAGRHVRRLIQEGYLTIDENVDPSTGIRSESYRWTGWLAKAAALHATGSAAKTARRETAEDGAAAAGTSAAAASGGEPNLFAIFEQEFGRPLSPMELETISAWLDQDRYPEELIRFALKEAVFAGKLHFRYIDRILLEWSRNRITNEEEAKARTQQFRGRM